MPRFDTKAQQIHSPQQYTSKVKQTKLKRTAITCNLNGWISEGFHLDKFHEQILRTLFLICIFKISVCRFSEHCFQFISSNISLSQFLFTMAAV